MSNLKNGIVVVGVLFVLWIVLSSGAPEKPVTLHKPEKTVTAAELRAAYDQNEIAAKRAFETTPIHVTGAVYSVSESSTVILSATPGELVALDMLPGNESVLATLKRGDKFAADCEHTIYMMDAVSPRDCRPAAP